jgi:hypothetical protein
LGKAAGAFGGAGLVVVGVGAGVGVVRFVGTAERVGVALGGAVTFVECVAEVLGFGSVPVQPVRASIATMLAQARPRRASVHTREA